MIDLSKKRFEPATTKKVYDKLVQAEILDPLAYTDQYFYYFIAIDLCNCVIGREKLLLLWSRTFANEYTIWDMHPAAKELVLF